MGNLLSLRNSKFLFGFLIAYYWVACAPKTFSKDPSVNACQNSSEVCIALNGRDYFDKTKNINGDMVDILFVNDNSGSMSFEQRHMAEKFSSFLTQLDSRSLDYRIGIITTDVSTSAARTLYPDNSNFWTLNNEARAINQNGALQDGNLITFEDGSSYITSDMPNREALFKKAIQRAETGQCETFLRKDPSSQPSEQGLIDNCPAMDERGIFAANLFFDKNPSSFIRPNAHLSVVFLSDEDERGSYELYQGNPGFALSPYDQPDTLLSKINSKYSGKSASFHAIIVKNEACKEIQSGQMGPSGSEGITFNPVSGSIGYKYGEARRLTNGILGNICAEDKDNAYGAQLINISANISDRIDDENLVCENPEDLTVTFDPPLDTITWTITGSLLHFNQKLPPGKVRYQYSCPTL